MTPHMCQLVYMGVSVDTVGFSCYLHADHAHVLDVDFALGKRCKVAINRYSSLASHTSQLKDVGPAATVKVLIRVLAEAKKTAAASGMKTLDLIPEMFASGPPLLRPKPRGRYDRPQRRKGRLR